jgi:hypothetical protein
MPPAAAYQTERLRIKDDIDAFTRRRVASINHRSLLQALQPHAREQI